MVVEDLVFAGLLFARIHSAHPREALVLGHRRLANVCDWWIRAVRPLTTIAVRAQLKRMMGNAG